MYGQGKALAGANYSNHALAEQTAQLSKTLEGPPRSEFVEYRERAYMSMSSLNEAVSELERRLNPVLRPVPVATGNAQGAGVGPALSPVAETLNGVANHASELRERVVALLDTLAV